LSICPLLLIVPVEPVCVFVVCCVESRLVPTPVLCSIEPLILSVENLEYCPAPYPITSSPLGVDISLFVDKPC